MGGKGGQALEIPGLRVLHPQFQVKERSWEAGRLDSKSSCPDFEVPPPEIKGEFSYSQVRVGKRLGWGRSAESWFPLGEHSLTC